MVTSKPLSRRHGVGSRHRKRSYSLKEKWRNIRKTMHATKEFNKKAFLKQFLLGLHISKSFSNPNSIQQRKNTIKLSADFAMAFARGRTHWTRALISKLRGKEENRSILKCMMGRKYDMLMARYSCPLPQQKVQRGRNIVRSYRFSCSSANKRRSTLKGSCVRVPPSVVARNLENRRTKVLKRLVPGGEFLNGSSLLSETLDYVISLKAQVDVMKSLWNASQISSSRNVGFIPSDSCKGGKPLMLANSKHDLHLFKKS